MNEKAGEAQNENSSRVWIGIQKTMIIIIRWTALGRKGGNGGRPYYSLLTDTLIEPHSPISAGMVSPLKNIWHLLFKRYKGGNAGHKRFQIY